MSRRKLNARALSMAFKRVNCLQQIEKEKQHLANTTSLNGRSNGKVSFKMTSIKDEIIPRTARDSAQTADSAGRTPGGNAGDTATKLVEAAASARNSRGGRSFL